MLGLALAALLAAAPAPPAVGCGPFTARLYASPRQAFAAVLQARPAVLGIGEYHELEGGPKVKSSLRRFTEGLLPQLEGRAAHLLAETWITRGDCGRTAQAATERIEERTERPARTEDEVLTLLKTAHGLGIAPHILAVECEDYQGLLGPDGAVDDVRLLLLVTRLLREKADELLARSPEGQALVIYGGAMHNEVAPPEELAEFSFGPHLKEATGGRYVQLGLYVPELVERDAEARKADWFACFQRHVSTRKTLLITLSPEAYLLVFPRTARPSPRR